MDTRNPLTQTGPKGSPGTSKREQSGEFRQTEETDNLQVGRQDEEDDDGAFDLDDEEEELDENDLAEDNEEDENY